MGREFRQFLLRGNVMDLAVAVIIGAAFGAVVTAMVEDLITPLIAALGCQPDFSTRAFTINGSVFKYGHFLNSVIAFVTIAAVVFLFAVKPMKALLARADREPPANPSTKHCPECLSDIPFAARRYAFCTSVVAA